MCFSAEASFVAGTVLVAGSIPTIRSALDKDKRFLALAAFPLFFGLQQLSEGVLWLSLDRDPTAPAPSAGMVFLFFAYFFWPVWVPLSASAIEDCPKRRRIFRGTTLLGICMGLVLYLPLLLEPAVLEITQVRHSIHYLNPEMFPNEPLKTVARLTYSVIICLPLLGSSHGQVRIFGGLILLSVIVGFAFASYAFTSIWCFLAAWVSAYIYVVMRRLPEPLRAG